MSPFPHLLRAGFRVTLNTDNRLMSGVTLTDEYLLAHRTFDLTLTELERVTANAINAAFHPYWDRRRILHERIEPGFEQAREEAEAAGLDPGPPLGRSEA